MCNKPQNRKEWDKMEIVFIYKSNIYAGEILQGNWPSLFYTWGIAAPKYGVIGVIIISAKHWGIKRLNLVVIKSTVVNNFDVFFEVIIFDFLVIPVLI